MVVDPFGTYTAKPAVNKLLLFGDDTIRPWVSQLEFYYSDYFQMIFYEINKLVLFIFIFMTLKI